MITLHVLHALLLPIVDFPEIAMAVMYVCVAVMLRVLVLLQAAMEAHVSSAQMILIVRMVQLVTRLTAFVSVVPTLLVLVLLTHAMLVPAILVVVVLLVLVLPPSA
jgi:hypothetical protein